MRGLSHLEDREGPRVAAFDADGVLWRGDVSEDFTRWMIERGLFDATLWPRYTELNASDPAAACLMILEFYRGMRSDQIRDYVREFWRIAPPRRWNQDAVQAIEWLRASGFSVYVVSGTPQVVLGELPHHLSVDRDKILGIDLEFDPIDHATGCSAGTVTCGPGKVQRLREVTTDPVLVAVGNSVLDIELVELSEDVHWVVEPDAALRVVAEREGWLVTQFCERTA